MANAPGILSRIVIALASAVTGYRNPRLHQVAIPVNWTSLGEPLMSGETKADMCRAFEREAVLYACIGAIATDVSSIPIKLVDAHRQEVVERERWPEWLTMFDQPNEFESFADLRFANVLDLLITGEMFTLWDRDIDELWWMPSWLTDALPSRTGRIAGYEMKFGATKQSFGIDEVVHAMRHGPRGITNGLGMIEPLAAMITSHSYQVEYEKQLNKNLGGPAGVLTTEQELTEDQANQTKETWRQNYGGASNAGRIAVLGKGATFTKIALSPVEMGASEADERYIKAVLSATGVPPARLGRETANFATAREQMTAYWLSVVTQVSQTILDAYNRRILWGSGFELRADTSQCYYLQLVLQQRIEIAIRATGGRPVMTPDEARTEVLGLAPVGQIMSDVLEPQQLNAQRDALLRALSWRQAITQNEARPVLGPLLGLSLSSHNDPEADEVNKAPPAFFPALGGTPDRLPNVDVLAEAAAASAASSEPARHVRMADERVREVWCRAAAWRVTRHRENLKRELGIARKELGEPLIKMLRIADMAAVNAARAASVEAFRSQGGEFRIVKPTLPEDSDFHADAVKMLGDYYLAAARRVGDEEFAAAKEQRRSMRSSAGLSVRATDDPIELLVDFNVEDPQVLEELARREQEIKRVSDRIQEQVRLQIAASLERGDSIDQMAASVEQLFDGWEDWEAERIATTESGSALNTAADAAMGQAGAEMKAWSHSGNPDGRPEHILAQGEGEIAFDGFFGRGSMAVAMPYPMASVGENGAKVPPGQIINCQCVHVVTSFGD